MKTIVISGACSNIGKTTLAKAVCDALPGAVFVKIGTGVKKEDSLDILYPFGTPFRDVEADHRGADFLVIESNHILAEIDPDLCIFLDGQRVTPISQRDLPMHEKPSAALARQKADIVRGQKVTGEQAAAFSRRLEVPLDKMHELCFLAGANPEPVSAIIMAGGASSRMGKNKALLSIAGKSMIRHIYDTLQPLFDEIIISVSKKGEPLIPDANNVVTVIDLKPGQGPLMGIYSGLSASSSRVNFVIACDIPTIDLPLMRKLLSCSCRYDIAVPSFKPQEFEPLFAVYTREVTRTAKTLLDRNQRRIGELFPLGKTKVVEIADCRWYANLNTPHDYQCFINEKREGDE
ncbi:MAG: molybdenum cofactor guanylyltransferase [bacterium]